MNGNMVFASDGRNHLQGVSTTLALTIDLKLD